MPKLGEIGVLRQASVTVFEFVARATRTGIIAAWVSPRCGIRLIKPIYRILSRGRDGLLRLHLLLLGNRLLHHGLLLFFGERADQGKLFGDINTQAVQQSFKQLERFGFCLLYTSPSPRDGLLYRMPSSA